MKKRAFNCTKAKSQKFGAADMRIYNKNWRTNNLRFNRRALTPSEIVCFARTEIKCLSIGQR